MVVLWAASISPTVAAAVRRRTPVVVLAAELEFRAPNSNPHGDGRGEVVHGWRGSRGPIYTSREGPGKAEASSAINGVGVMAETKRINDGRN